MMFQSGPLASLPGIRVLMVDNVLETRETLQKTLFLEADIEVVGVVAGGEQAVEMAIERQPDIVLLDLTLPGVDGFKAIEQILRQVPSAQIITMSAYGEPDYLRRSMLGGAREFLIKPFSACELITSIRRVFHWRSGGPLLSVLNVN